MTNGEKRGPGGRPVTTGRGAAPLGVRLSTDEERELREAARRAAVPLSVYVREAALKMAREGWAPDEG